MSIYARVMQVLRLEGDLALLAADDELGRKLHDAGITPKLRAPNRTSATKLMPEAQRKDVFDGRPEDGEDYLDLAKMAEPALMGTLHCQRSGDEQGIQLSPAYDINSSVERNELS